MTLFSCGCAEFPLIVDCFKTEKQKIGTVKSKKYIIPTKRAVKEAKAKYRDTENSRQRALMASIPTLTFTPTSMLTITPTIQKQQTPKNTKNRKMGIHVSQGLELHLYRLPVAVLRAGNDTKQGLMSPNDTLYRAYRNPLANAVSIPWESSRGIHRLGFQLVSCKNAGKVFLRRNDEYDVKHRIMVTR